MENSSCPSHFLRIEGVISMSIKNIAENQKLSSIATAFRNYNIA